ncbi:hypothetical protein [Streptomyces sp. NPDC005989]|uniref:hypothetical protein n=1 Tax=Streptomyces sp. NPDC005989 TaxID=3156727 RepID=UPI0033C42A1D
MGWGSAHPGHPHPAFSPDGRLVAFTDTEAATDRTRVVLCDSRGGWTPRPLDRVAEAEELAFSVSGGRAEVFADPQCGAGHGLLFTPAAGDALTCEFQSPDAGLRTLRLRAKRHDSRGIRRLSVNGTPVGAPLDLYNPVMTYDEPEFGQVRTSGDRHAPPGPRRPAPRQHQVPRDVRHRPHRPAARRSVVPSGSRRPAPHPLAGARAAIASSIRSRAKWKLASSSTEAR